MRIEALAVILVFLISPVIAQNNSEVKKIEKQEIQGNGGKRTTFTVFHGNQTTEFSRTELQPGYCEVSNCEQRIKSEKGFNTTRSFLENHSGRLEKNGNLSVSIFVPEEKHCFNRTSGSAGKFYRCGQEKEKGLLESILKILNSLLTL